MELHTHIHFVLEQYIAYVCSIPCPSNSQNVQLLSDYCKTYTMQTVLLKATFCAISVTR